MKKIQRLFTAGIGALLAGALLAGCATNGASQIPSTTKANLNQNALQFAVGTAYIGQDSSVGLNVVATLRQPDGLSGALADQPTITGPSGFTVPAGTPGAYSSSRYGPNVDAGTNHISGSPQVPRNNAGLVNSTLGTFTGVFSYGFGPYNCDQNCTNIGAYFPGNPTNTTGNGFPYSAYGCGSFVCNNSGSPGDVAQVQPFFGTGFEYVLGAPAVPFFQDGTYPGGFSGYSPGFTAFEVAPVSGQYSLSVLVPAQNTAPVTYNATAALNAGIVLGPITVSVTGATGGGLTGTVNGVPAGATETGVFVVDVHTDPNSGVTSQNFYTVGPLSGTGTVSWTLPGNLGPCVGSGCQNTKPTPSIQTGDTYFVAAVSYDYPAFEAAPPMNHQEKPAITNASGQADLTMSPYAGPSTY